MAGSYEIYYFDKDRNVVDKESAVEAVVRELDENGNLITETWAVIEKEDPNKHKGDNDIKAPSSERDS